MKVGNIIKDTYSLIPKYYQVRNINPCDMSTVCRQALRNRCTGHELEINDMENNYIGKVCNYGYDEVKRSGDKYDEIKRSKDKKPKVSFEEA